MHISFFLRPHVMLAISTAFFLAGCDQTHTFERVPSKKVQENLETLKPYLHDKSTYLRGIDVSHWNGHIDWHAVASEDIAFAYIKVSEGVTLDDAHFTVNWQQSSDNNILHGGYHVFVAHSEASEEKATKNGAAQAQHFLSRLASVPKGDIGTLPPVLDIEHIPKEKQKIAKPEIIAWLTEVQHRLGCSPIIYTSPDTWDEEDLGDFSAYRLWVADYNAPPPALPKGWKNWLFWQYTDKEEKPAIPHETAQSSAAEISSQPHFPIDTKLGAHRKIRGILGNTDLDIFNGSHSDLIRTTCTRGL